ncbi:helix-turn-helix domain-containing protein [Embleya sp. MST-111070]|uniref:helix-turn-helix domain-containing protein n=1 Tax=Embleya sp. MST-111070 TaxID=3398231 RepID=UPI003F738D05
MADPADEIAADVGRGYGSVHRLLVEAGVEMRTRGVARARRRTTVDGHDPFAAEIDVRNDRRELIVIAPGGTRVTEPAVALDGAVVRALPDGSDAGRGPIEQPVVPTPVLPAEAASGALSEIGYVVWDGPPVPVSPEG